VLSIITLCEVIKIQTKFLVIALLTLLLLLVPVFTAETPQPIYKVGDYFTYKAKRTTTSRDETCTIEFNGKIVVTSIEYPYVYYNITYTNIKTSGNCPSGGIFSEGYTTTGLSRIDVKPVGPGLDYFVDPSYSGDYSNSTEMWGVKMTATAKYKNGVLISGTMEYESSMVKSSISIELVETSISGLIPGSIELVETSIPGLITSWWSWIIIVAVIAAVVVILLVLVLKKLRKPIQPTPVPPPTPPPITPQSTQ